MDIILILYIYLYRNIYIINIINVCVYVCFHNFSLLKSMMYAYAYGAWGIIYMQSINIFIYININISIKLLTRMTSAELIITSYDQMCQGNYYIYIYIFNIYIYIIIISC
jgi:hypothetical protein